MWMKGEEVGADEYGLGICDDSRGSRFLVVFFLGHKQASFFHLGYLRHFSTIETVCHTNRCIRATPIILSHQMHACRGQ